MNTFFSVDLRIQARLQGHVDLLCACPSARPGSGRIKAQQSAHRRPIIDMEPIIKNPAEAGFFSRHDLDVLKGALIGRELVS
jgi:hypothetical protein